MKTVLLSSLALAGTAARLPDPAAWHRLHRRAVVRALRDVGASPDASVLGAPRRPRIQKRPRPGGDRRVQEAPAGEENAVGPPCPGTAFLWKIVEEATGRHVGFGLGTMHLPVDVVATPSAYETILFAIEDSCAVYGELNLLDADVVAGVEACGATVAAGAATVADLPDPTLREAFEAKVLEISAAIAATVTLTEDEGANAVQAADLAQLFATRLLTQPLPAITQLIALANTPEYADKYLHTFYSGEGAVMLDEHLLSLGRPAGGLEELATHCDALRLLYPTAGNLTADFALHADDFRAAVNASLTREIDLYECGDADAFMEGISDGMALDEEGLDFLLKERNIQMAARMQDILEVSEERVLFAVGLAHWLLGPDDLGTLLREYGYVLERVEGWGQDSAANPSNEACDVVFHPEEGRFVPTPEDGIFAPAGGDTPTMATSEPTSRVVKDTHYTLLTGTEAPTPAPLGPDATSPSDGDEGAATGVGDGGMPSSVPALGNPTAAPLSAEGTGDGAGAVLTVEAPSSGAVRSIPAVVLFGSVLYLWTGV